MRISLPIITCIVLILTSCETEVDIITAVTKTVPIVYAVIDPYDSIKSVRVQRSFIIYDTEGAQLQDEDSLYFDKVEVFLGGKTNGITQWQYQLERVDIDKENGKFTGSNHHVYQLKSPLPIEISETYNGYDNPNVAFLFLKINIIDTGDTLYSESPVFSPGWITKSPRGKSIGVYGRNSSKFLINATTIAPNMSFNYQEIVFKVNILEFSNTGKEEVTVEWRTVRGFGEYGYYLTPERLFNRIMMGLEDTPNISTRILNSIDIKMTIARENYGDYMANLSPFEGLIDYPIQGIEKAYGFFHTKTSGYLTGLNLDRESMDSLCNSPKWSHLKFKHW